MSREVSKTRFEGAAPILSGKDMSASVRYYVNVLGFRNADCGTEDFTSVSRAGAGIYLCRGAQGCPGTWAWLGADDVAALYPDCRGSGANTHRRPRNHS